MNRKQLASLRKNPLLAFVGVLSTEAFRWLPDDLFLKIVYRCRLGKKLPLKNPQTFNEKLQWLKLFDHRPEYITYVDKYAVREHIRTTIGEEHLVPLIGVWDNADSIDFDALPDRCVLKCTHDSGGVIVYDRSRSDVEAVRNQLSAALKKDFYLRGREWPYKHVCPRIIAETFLDTEDTELMDYKFLCFHGVPEMLMVCSSRTAMGVNVTFLDLDWNRLPFERHYPAAPEPLSRPKSLNKMIDIAAQLSAGIPFVRVDLYEVHGQVYFGELTFYPGCGFEEFHPEEWDMRLGEMIQLPGSCASQKIPLSVLQEHKKD
ncbi:MAG: glycosyl transferase [Oscillospiraceae bacterium]|nr:glycosyl transferase [Oscillospiraceae bacterium]